MNIPARSLLEGDNQASSLALTTTNANNAAKEKTWVTCFGFTPGQSDVVIRYLQSVKGLSVVDFEPKNDRSGNWIHIKFRSQKDVAVALGESGQVLELNGAKIMIGIIPFLEGDQLDARKASAGEQPQDFQKKATQTGGPQRASTLWEKAVVWVMDL
jgi:hypothetical protein